VVACYVDMTERRRLLDQLRDSARRDPLTRMPNRSVVLERVQRAIEHRRRHPGYGFAVLFMDVDRFKQVNDTLGHGAGDELLRQVADASGRHAAARRRRGARGLRACTPRRASAATNSSSCSKASTMSTTACTGGRPAAGRAVAPYQLGSHPVHVSVSIGIVGAEQAGDDAGAVLRDCDTAMYEAKRAGRGRWMVFDASMHERVRTALELEGELRRALAERRAVRRLPAGGGPGRRGAWPVWKRWCAGTTPSAARSRRPVHRPGRGMRAHRRHRRAWCWTRPARSLRSGARWGERAPGLLAVNLSRAQLKQPGLVPEVQAVLQANGMRPEQLQLEVTESFAAQDEQVQAMLRALKAAGVRLALDDFGTGYSSLACLHQLPVDTVKVDRSFVAHAREVEYHRVLISATIRMARTLGMVTVAEGIETEDQAALMLELDCDRGQGWLFGRPMTAEALDRWIEAASQDSLV
jgi:predicted signal transduction protein with EAL and GGDEF domain